MEVQGDSVFEYLYRDASNYKAFGELLLTGHLTGTEVAEVVARFDDGEYFIAEQVGVPPLYQELWQHSGGPTDDDHPWHEFITIRHATQTDVARLPPWGTAIDLHRAVTAIALWDEKLSPHQHILAW